MRSISSLLPFLTLVVRIYSWEHASEVELLHAINERRKPLLVAYIFDSPEQNFEKHWGKVEDEVQQQQQIDTSVMSIDCSASLATCLQLDVKAYPAIRLYHPNGRISRYRGPRKSRSILSFLHRVSKPIISDLSSSPDSVNSFISSDEIVFTVQFAPSEARLYEEHYRQLARRYHDRYSFGIITQLETGESTIRCYNNINTETFTLRSSDLPLANSLAELVSQCTAPLIYEPIGRKELADLATLSSQNAKSGLIVHFFTAKSTSTEPNPPSNKTMERETQDKIKLNFDIDLIKDRYKKEITPLAKKYAGQILFTVIDGDEHPGMGPHVGGLPLDVPSGVAVENIRTGQLFPYLPALYATQREKDSGFLEGDLDGISVTELEWLLGQVIGGNVKPWDGVPYNSVGIGTDDNAEHVGHDEL